ncbi:MAG: hypothetical protein KL785_09180 [Brevundimonas sp.]|nr:hypothetical protein [Brevundimonas sp.]
MKLLRFVVVLAVLAYAGWLAWPFLSPFLEGAGPEAAALRAGAEAQGGGELFGFLPVWALWIGAIALYVISALMLGSGNSKSAIAYFLAFIADAALRLALDQRDGDAARSGPATMSAPEAAGSPADGPDLADAGGARDPRPAGRCRRAPHPPGAHAGSVRLLDRAGAPIWVGTVDADPARR